MKTVIVVSGPDRAGKSTLLSKIPLENLHFGPPDDNAEDIFEMYREGIVNTKEKIFCFDRGWPDAFVLEEFRRNATDKSWKIMEFELKLKSFVQVFHVGLFPAWSEVVDRHIEEIPKKLSLRKRTDILYQRMREHRYYLEQMGEFFNHYTLFPSKSFSNSTFAEEYIRSFIK